MQDTMQHESSKHMAKIEWYDGNSCWVFDPSDLRDFEDFTEQLQSGDIVPFIGSFGGSYWPNYYILLAWKHSMDEPDESAMSDIMDTAESRHHLLEGDDLAEAQEMFPESMRFQNGYYHQGWYTPETVEVLRRLTDEEIVKLVAMFPALTFGDDDAE